MKQLIILIAMIPILCHDAFSQNTPTIIGKTFAVKQQVDVTQSSNKGEKLINPLILNATEGKLFKVVGVDETGSLYIIQFLPFKGAPGGPTPGKSEKSEPDRIDLLKKQIADQHKEILKNEILLIDAQTAILKRQQDSLDNLRRQILTNVAPQQTPNDATRKMAPSSYVRSPVADASTPVVSKDISGLGELYFTISAKDFATVATDQFNYKNSFVIFSSLVMPYKMNFGNRQAGSRFDIFNNMTIGPAFGWRLRPSSNPLSTQAVNFLLNIGLSTIKVDQSTLPGLVTEASNYSAFTIGGGIAYEFDKIQLGIFTGLDILTGNANHAYAYRNSPYLGIGIGFQVFSFKTAGSSQ